MTISTLDTWSGEAPPIAWAPLAFLCIWEWDGKEGEKLLVHMYRGSFYWTLGHTNSFLFTDERNSTNFPLTGDSSVQALHDNFSSARHKFNDVTCEVLILRKLFLKYYFRHRSNEWAQPTPSSMATKFEANSSHSSHLVIDAHPMWGLIVQVLSLKEAICTSGGLINDYIVRFS